MNIGIKLDIGFQDDDRYRLLYGNRKILASLVKRGVSVVETPVGPETEEEPFLNHLQQVRDAGLDLFLHPYSESTPYNPARFTEEPENPSLLLHRRILTFARMAAERQGRECRVTIHPAAAGNHVERGELVRRSAAFFRWAVRWCASEAEGVRPLAELQISPNPDETIVRVGDRYEELIRIARDGGVGVTLDIGHAVLNARRYGWPEDPPPDLLPLVRHVHCHDVGDSDHRPLGYGTAPYRRFLERLRGIGYRGTVLLEVIPDGFLSSGGFESLDRSLALLREYTARSDAGSASCSSAPRPDLSG